MKNCCSVTLRVLMLAKRGPHQADSPAASEAFYQDFGPVGMVGSPGLTLLERPGPDSDLMREEHLRLLRLRAQAVAASAGLVHIFNHFTAFNLAHHPLYHPPASAYFPNSEDGIPPL